MKRTPLTKIMIITSVLGVVAGCADFQMDLDIRHASSLPLNRPPVGPPEFQQGFKDGCQTGYAAWGSVYAHTMYAWKQDPVLARNPVYQQIWNDAYSYCRIYAEQVDEHVWGNYR